MTRHSFHRAGPEAGPAPDPPVPAAGPEQALPRPAAMPPPRLRVLFLIGRDTYGGLEDYIRELARSVVADGARATICYAALPEEETDLARRLGSAGLEVRVIRLDSRLLTGLPRNLRSLIELGRLLVREEIGLLHIHLSPFHVYFLAVLLARLLLVPRVVLHLVGLEPDRQRRERLADPIIARMVDRIVVISRSLRDQARDSGFTTDRYSVIYMGEDLRRFDPNRADGRRLREEFGVPAEGRVVGMVARLHILKGQETLLRAAARVLERLPSVHFLFVGSGDAGYRRRLEEMAARLGIAGRVHFLGHRWDIPDITAALDVAVLPTENEAMGHCLLEAMALGKPVIATRVGGVPEAVRDGEDGYLIEPGDEGALAAHLLRLLHDPRERRILGEKGRSRVAAHFRLEDWVRRTRQFYRDLAAGRPRQVYEE